MEFLEGSALDAKLKGREPLKGNIKLRNRASDIEYEDFMIYGVVNTGGSCICYSAAKKLRDGSRKLGILKEFYPIDGDEGSQDKGKQAFHLKRYSLNEGLRANQLYSDESTLSNFEDAKNEFFRAHRTVEELINSRRGVDSYFQNFEIYKGISKTGDGNHTFYIWTAGDSGLVSFEDYLDDMHSRVKKEIGSPRGNLSLYLAKELHFILQSVKALAKGVLIIHQKDMLHLDIKPSNFGVRDLGERNGDNVSIAMFDINSLYSRNGVDKIRACGTKYFAAPELSNGTNDAAIDCRSDIFSLGATLYNSIVMSQDNREFYDVDGFSEISGKLRHSLLFEYSEHTSALEITDGLVQILKRSLARRPDDYAHGITNFESVGEFIDAINAVDIEVNKIITLLIKEGTSKKATLSVTDRETYYSKAIEKMGGADSAMQCLLYDYPLYNYVQNGKLNVLVLGAGVFGQKFLDNALVLSQVKGCYLNIVVASKDKEADERRYLESRPEFGNYFWVNGKKPAYAGKFDSSVHCDYGRVSFVELESALADNSEENIAVLEKALSSNEKFGYVFISLSDELLSKRIASDLTKTSLLNSGNSIVNFVTYEKLPRNKAETKIKTVIPADADCSVAKLNPVFVTGALISQHRDCFFLHNIAFNCHILWESNLGLDMQKTYESFMSPYYYTASMSMAVSLKYKLNSIGLNLEDVRAEKTIAARREKLLELSKAYREKIGIGAQQRTPDQQKCLDELTMYEHARWNTEKICSSHRVLPEREFGNLTCGNKDKAQRKHSCLLPSGSDWALGKGNWDQKLSTWDNAGLLESNIYKNLDPLDKMSVQLHRHYMKIAKGFKMDVVQKEAEIVKRLIGENYELIVAFDAYINAMSSVMMRQKRKSSVMEHLEHRADVFSKVFEETTLSNKTEIKKSVKRIKELFAPVKEAYSFIDYKEIDHRILVSLPFILNYNVEQRLCIPMVVDQVNNRWFDNVASCVVINPASVTYLVNAESASKIATKQLLKILSNITKLMDNHNLQTKIDIIFYVDTSEGALSEDAVANARAALKEVSPRINGIDFVERKSDDELKENVKNTLATIQKSALRFSAVETRANNDISGVIADVRRELDIFTYRFDSVAMRFIPKDGSSYCWFNDIPFNAHLNVEDAFIAHGRLGIYSDPELYKDYSAMWKIACSDYRKMAAWKALCAVLGNAVDKGNGVLSFKVNKSRVNSANSVDTMQLLPSFCRASIEKILKFLADDSIGIVDNWSTAVHNSTMFRVKFTSNDDVRKSLVQLLSTSMYVLADESKVRTEYYGGKAHIIVDSLVVENFDFHTSVNAQIAQWERDAVKQNDFYATAREIFKEFIKRGYILDMSDPEFLSFNSNQSLAGQKFKFCFASEQIKSLLTVAGQLAELYTYYKLIDSGLYDDVGISLVVQRHDDDGGIGEEYVTTQEFDVVAIKGFTMQLIEVKCTNTLEQSFYKKLRANGDHFGINCKLLLVSLSADKFHKNDNKSAITNGEIEDGVKTIIGNVPDSQNGKAVELEDVLAKIMEQRDED